MTPATILKATLIGLFSFCPLITPIVAHANTAEQEKAGKALYEQQCARCHQRDGAGVDGLYPSLRNAPSLWLDRKTAIRGVLAGRADDTVVNSPLMPTHGYLGNETIASRGPYLTVVLSLGAETVGLAVDEACEVITLAPEQVAASPRGVVAGEAVVGERLVRILDPTRLEREE